MLLFFVERGAWTRIKLITQIQKIIYFYVEIIMA